MIREDRSKSDELGEGVEDDGQTDNDEKEEGEKVGEESEGGEASWRAEEGDGEVGLIVRVEDASKERKKRSASARLHGIDGE